MGFDSKGENEVGVEPGERPALGPGGQFVDVQKTLQPFEGEFDLPAQAVKYVRRIEELTEAPVTLLSTSPERDDTIMVRDPFEG